jgi:subtilisin family serine protease
MEKLFAFIHFILILGLVSIAEGQDYYYYYYYYYGEKVPLIQDTSKIGIQFHKGQAKGAIDPIEIERREIKEVKQFLTNEDSLLVDLIPGLSNVEEDALRKELKMKQGVKGVSPAFRVVEGSKTFALLTDEILVKWKEGLSEMEVETMNKENGVVETGALLDGEVSILSAEDGDPMHALDVANLYTESGLVEWAEPNFTGVGKEHRTVPNDTYIGSPTDWWSWHIDWNVSWRADINAPEGWDLNKGSTSVIIAVVDSGVALAHSDLNAKLVTGYDATGGTGAGQSNPWEYHGTAVAGIAAAVTNNNRGVAGVCWYCKIMPIRAWYRPCDGCDTVDSLDWQAAGIDWAWQHGAAVINMSYGWHVLSATQDAAINRARTQGRGGKGTVLVASAGNGETNTSIQYPANNPQVVAVGASNPCGTRKTNNGCSGMDGEWWWQSSFGPEIDVVAPGVKIYTTDALGVYGKNTAGNDYMSDFNGTSASAPQVSGLAGLLISKNTARTATTVIDIIRRTAYDVSPAGFDNETGYGLIDVYKALQQP